MQAWTQFYATIGTAAAALLGLLFVVVSINVSVALGPEQAVSRRLTEQAFQNYLAVMLASWSTWVVIRFFQTLALHIKERSWIYSLPRHVTSLIGFAILLVSALRMALNWGEAYNGCAAATLVLLFSATAVSWELLRRIANRPSA